MHDFISFIKKKLSGNKNISFEISRLEDSFAKMFAEADNVTGNQTEKFSIDCENAIVDENILRLVERVKTGNAEKSERIYIGNVTE